MSTSVAHKNLQDFDYISEIRTLNEMLGFDGSHSYIYEMGNEIEIGIEAPNHTVSVTNLEEKEILSAIEDDDFKLFMIDAYLTSIKYFDIDAELQEDWVTKFKKQHKVNCSQVRFMIDDDIEYFKRRLYVSEYIINSSKI
ncbi:hypothetical protein ACFYSI_13160 [Staphylococcus xylosus]|uniref:hypothetical protein n=1 Tax=Staphylococcus xylosus TaxID=1288 RepID=UPI0036BE5E1C